MAGHRRRMPLVALLIRLGWQRDPELWTVHCRDSHGRRTRLLVQLTATGIALTVPGVVSLHLEALQIGRLRAALRDAVCSLARLGTAVNSSDMPSGSSSPPPVRPSTTRQRIEFTRPTRPSVAQLTARFSPRTAENERARDRWLGGHSSRRSSP